MKQPCIHFLLVLVVVLSGCGGQPEVEATPQPTPSLAPLPTPSPALALGLRKQGIVFHDLTESEQVCPGFVEILTPVEISPEQISGSSMNVIRQVRFVCTNDEKGTVYFVDTKNGTITVVRKQPPVQGCRKSMVKSCRQGILLLSLVLVLAGCRGTPPPAPTPLPTPTTAAASPAFVPSPQPWPEGVLFYELEEPEQTCLGYQEYLSFRETITQIKIVCTQQGVETVYFIDTEKQVVTIVRIPIPLTVKPQE